MPDDVRNAVVEGLEQARFITEEQELSLFRDGLLDDPRMAIVYIGPLTNLGNNVVAVDIGVVTNRLGTLFETHLFEWDGNDWIRVFASETGITVTTSVS